MASKGRNGDSMLVHMTPGEVHGLQALAMKHGGSLTTNPDTGLPEANFLKSLLPILAGFALGPAGMGIAFGGLSSAASAGLLVGGVTGLATGSLSKGLMAGLGAYGGAGLGGGLSELGAGELAQGQISANMPTLAEGATQAQIEAYTQQVNDLRTAGLQGASQLPMADKLSAGFSSATASPMDAFNFAKDNKLALGMAAAPIMADMMVPTTTKSAPIQSPGRIVEKRWNGREFVPVASTDASVFNTSGRSFADPYRGYNNGGIVALAGGGMPRDEGGITSLAAGGDAALAAYQSGNYGEASRLLAEAGMSAQDVVSKYGLSQADAAAVAKNLGYAGDMSGIQYAAAPPPVVQAATTTAPITQAATTTTAVAPTYTNYTNEQIGSYLATNPTADIAAATKATNADPAAVNAYIASLTTPFVGSTDTKGGSGTLGIYNQLTTQGVDPDEYYKAALANDPKYAGWALADIKRGYKLDEGALALSKQIEKDKIAADPVLGYDKQWVKFMEDGGYSVNDMAQAFGISKNDIIARIQKVKDAERKVVTPITCPAGYRPNAAGTACELIPITKDLPPPINTTQNTTTNVVTPTDLYTAPASSLPVGVSGNTGPSQIGGGATINPNGTITTSPRIPGIPVGGFTGLTSLRDAYTKGGGSLGYTSPKFDKIEDFNAKYVDKRLTGDSKAAYDYLTGKAGAAYPTKSGVGQISEDYATAVLGYPARGNLPYIYNKATGRMDVNPDYVAPGRNAAGDVTYSMSLNDIKSSLKESPLSGQALYDWAQSNNLSAQQIADATGRSLSSVYADFRAGSKSKAAADKKTADDKAIADAANSKLDDSSTGGEAAGGLQQAYAMGGATGYALGGLGTLGGYSDGGRLLKGPGDGVSDSIPATIGRKQQPARLADGEFVVPARIVSELGNGSTDAGAKKLYAMMDRVQRARGKTTGKNKVAANSRADKYLPA
jgi:hypothetical protein